MQEWTTIPEFKMYLTSILKRFFIKAFLTAKCRKGHFAAAE
jgi:hypothetical protein